MFKKSSLLEVKSGPGALEYRAFDFEMKASADKPGRFEGYGSIFGNVDDGLDVVVAGAFKESLELRAKSNRKVPVLWSHDSRTPIGVYETVKEDTRGLWVEGVLLVDEVQKAKETWALMKAGAVTGLSIGYRVPEGGADFEKSGVRLLKKLHLEEVSPVTFPMNDEARVESVKARALHNTIKSGRLPTLAEFEDFLRDAGFSKSQATAIASHGLRKLRSESDSEPAAEEVVDLLKNWRVPELKVSA